MQEDLSAASTLIDQRLQHWLLPLLPLPACVVAWDVRMQVYRLLLRQFHRSEANHASRPIYTTYLCLQQHGKVCPELRLSAPPTPFLARSKDPLCVRHNLHALSQVRGHADLSPAPHGFPAREIGSTRLHPQRGTASIDQ